MTEQLITSFLGAPPGLVDWRVAHLASRKRILAGWLSEVEAAGGTLDAGAAAYLARVRRRVRALHSLGAELAATYDVTVIKGQAIARHLPPGVLRQSGDVDLVAHDEHALWQVVLDLRERCGAVLGGLSVLRAGEDRQLGVWLKWPAEEPLLDKPMGADVTTCTFAGDLKTVPVRTVPTAEEDLLNLFAVAEERFQQKYRVKDLVDLSVLVPVLVRTYGDDLADVVACWAEQLCLAPELLRLSRKVHDWRDLPGEWLLVMDRLVEPAARERALRRAGGRTIHTARYGLALDDEPAEETLLSIHSTSDGELATTPAGTFLLVDSDTVDQDTYERALRAATHLHKPVQTSHRKEERPCGTPSASPSRSAHAAAGNQPG
jgi:hypothetical protein